MTAFIRLITALSRFFGGVAAALVLVMLGLVVYGTVQRYGLGGQAAWQYELVTYLVMAITFLASPYVLARGGHVGLDVVVRHLGRGWRIVLGLVATLFSLGFCLGLVWTGIDLLGEAVTEGWRTDAAGDVRLWIPYLSLPIGVTLLALQFVANLLGYLGGREPPLDSGDGFAS